MTYQVVLRPHTAQGFRAVTDARERGLIARKLEEIANAPLQLGKPLHGNLAGYRSVHATRRYRIIWRVNEQRELVIVVLIGIRRAGSPEDVYETAKRLISRGTLDPPDVDT